MGTGGSFPGGKGRPGRHADHSRPSSAEVVNEHQLYLLSPQAPPWSVAGLLYFTFYVSTYKLLKSLQTSSLKYWEPDRYNKY
jgi:hypothetical protein